ncbi:MAG: S4 domain-containing protein, partial [Pseudomonadota bacterium]
MGVSCVIGLLLVAGGEVLYLAAMTAKPQSHKRPSAQGRKLKPPKLPPSPAAPASGERIAKRMARAGLCSRRDAERWIEDGRVRVNGKVLATPACVVTPKDRIEVDGNPLPQARALGCG